MAALIPAIQVISKTDHTSHHIVPIQPDTTPLPPDSNTVRIRTTLLSLTTNTFSYARHGGMGFPGLDWWNTFPFPASLPAPYNDPAKYCRIAAWGFSEVTESTIPDLPVGTQFFGYQPIGTAAETLTLTKGLPGRWVESSDRRKGLLNVYNEYIVVSDKEKGTTEEAKRSKGLDALFRPLFQSSFLLNRFSFAWEGEGVHPLGIKEIPWTAEDADLKGAVVFLLAPSGKTGLAFAHQLRRARPAGEQPRKVVAVGSGASRAFTVKTGLFDEVLEYGDVDVAGKVEGVVGEKPGKIVAVNFGARGEAPDKWVKGLKPLAGRVQVVLVGTSPGDSNMSKLAGLAMEPGSGVFQMNAGGLSVAASEVLGTEKYNEALSAGFEAFKADGAAGLKVVSGRGIDDYAKGWDSLVTGKYDPEVGLVYELP
ncbi:hypothetical protein QBC34DRAFT_415681 [Podospora aff. communis PSN243]|uniref:Uncharacterized protein n=1 Tax=Podospora aff. communis PSN243 TaxID=3040156 RepID=A0AAV9G6K6_9PEZI|nr:hypothetical protein QBC34DRAFT_415681 [Podospora aff. communis PSN243]